MEKLKVFICENFYPEYHAAIKKEAIDDIELIIYPTLCDHKGKKKEVKEILSKSKRQNSIIVCNKFCDALKLIDEKQKTEIISGNYCFSNLTSEEFLNHLTKQGNYLVSLGWLENWKKHIETMGFDQETAQRFFKETSKQIVFLDAKINDEAESLLKEFSSYVGLPYLTLSIELETLRLLLKSKVYEKRLHQQNLASQRAINKLRSQSADYSAVFDMLGKISSYTKKEDVMNKIQDIFMTIFGVQNFKFFERIPEELQDFSLSDDRYVLFREEKRFCMKVTWDDHLYGILDASDFLFPEYIDRYVNFVLDITKFLGLVLHNNEQYEVILDSEKELKYLSYHDCMTGLHNRTYINQLLSEKAKDKKIVVFMFDIDKLKYVNDTFGHAAGDALITSFADVLKKCFNEGDIVARIGGDEFTGIIYNADEKKGQEVIRCIQEKVVDHNKNIDNSHLTLNVSVGYALSEHPDQSIEDILKRADFLMYENKYKKDR